MGHLDSQVCKYKHHYCTVHLVHMVMAYMDLMEVLKLKNQYVNFEHEFQKNLSVVSLLTKCSWRTIDEWITGISFRTSTSWCMIYNCTTCIQATRSWTRISTFLLNACLICYAIRINRAFWSAIRWNSDIIVHASTDWCFSYGFAHRVWTTR